MSENPNAIVTINEIFHIFKVHYKTVHSITFLLPELGRQKFTDYTLTMRSIL